MGVDWADHEHVVWVSNETGQKVTERVVPQTPEGGRACGRWLDEQRAAGIEVWAAIETPEGRIVEVLLDHGVVVSPINPKALDRARDRYRVSPTKSDRCDAWVLAEMVRTDHPHQRALPPSSDAVQEVKLLMQDDQRLVRQQTRVLNQLTVTLKEDSPRPLEVVKDLTTPLAQDFLRAYSTPEALRNRLTRRSRVARCCRAVRARLAVTSNRLLSGMRSSASPPTLRSHKVATATANHRRSARCGSVMRVRCHCHPARVVSVKPCSIQARRPYQHASEVSGGRSVRMHQGAA